MVRIRKTSPITCDFWSINFSNSSFQNTIVFSTFVKPTWGQIQEIHKTPNRNSPINKEALRV